MHHHLAKLKFELAHLLSDMAQRPISTLPLDELVSMRAKERELRRWIAALQRGADLSHR